MQNNKDQHNLKSVNPPSDNYPGLAVRLTAIRLLGAVVDKKTSLDGLVDDSHGHPHYLALSVRDRGLCRAIVGAALRNRSLITTIIDGYLERPLPENARGLKNLLHSACAQILFLNVADHAAIDLAVTAAKNDPRSRRFCGLVNAVLRKIASNKLDLLASKAQHAQPPAWFLKLLQDNYGQVTTTHILEALATQPALDLTVKADPELWARKLGGVVLPTGTVRIAEAVGPIDSFEGFKEGDWWVQNAAASIPAKLFGSIKDLHIADLCAAPGGKSAQMAHLGARVTAIDLSSNRLKRLQSNMERLKLKVDCWVGNFKDYPANETFDAVLLDAPCSSTGTIRRHPDILWTKNLSDIKKLADLQRDLLIAAFRLVKRGGTIVFSNCSLAKEEGEEVVSDVLRQHQQIGLAPILKNELPGMENLITKDGYLRTTPADFANENPILAGLDGFFAARLIKR